MEIIPVWIHNNYIDYKKRIEKERIIFPVLVDNCPEEILSFKEKELELKQILKELMLDRWKYE